MTSSRHHRAYPRRRPLPTALRVILSAGGYLLLAAVAFAVTAFLTAYLYLTPARLTTIANTQASRFLNADVSLHNLDYKLFSTFPTLTLTADSIEIFSRTLDSLPADIKRTLPEDASFLASSGKLSISLDIKEAVRKNLVIPDVEISRPRGNIVIVNDSTNNFDIVPPGLRLPRLNKLAVGKVHIGSPVEMRLSDIPSETYVSTSVNHLILRGMNDGRRGYDADVAVVVNGDVSGFAIPRNLRVNFSGAIIPDNGGITFGGGTSLTAAAGNVEIPHSLLAKLPVSRVDFPITVEVTLPRAYTLNLTAPEPPTFNASVDIPRGKGIVDTIPLAFSIKVGVGYDNGNPAGSRLDIKSVELKGDGGQLNMKGTLGEILTKTPIADMTISGEGDMAKISRLIPGGKDKLPDGDISGHLNIKGIIDPESAVMANGLEIEGTIKSNSMAFSFPGSHMGLTLNGLNLELKGGQRKQPYKAKRYVSTAATSENDRVVERNVAHTPLFLTVNLPEKARELISTFDLSAKLQVASGTLTADAYPAPNTFTNLLLETNLDSLKINSVDLSTRGASAHIEGSVDGLRDFLLTPAPAPLAVSLDAGFSDIDINRLAGNYYAGQKLITGETPPYQEATPSGTTASDSLCIVIPRNLAVNARLHADRAEYMQWEFSPLSADIILKEGDATLKDLTITAPYAKVDADWTYSTADLDSIYMSVKADVDNFNFRKFLIDFPEIAYTAPQLQNLDADVSLHADGSFLMFPTMFVNAPSIEGNATLDASGISFAREGKIAKITHFMLIKGDTPLTVDTLHIAAAFHDNLLQIDPFTLDCNGYKLLVGGVNNMQGEIYYHVGLLSTPFHLPFGVNIVGNYHHPGIRFGGRWIKDGRERTISSDLGDDVEVNIMQQLAHGWQLFVGNAAKYDSANNQSYVSDVN